MDLFNESVLAKMTIFMLGVFFLIPGISGLVYRRIVFRVKGIYGEYKLEERRTAVFGILFLIASIALFWLCFKV